ncbi:uncharacterized protein LOC122663380 [Telopea speciosissima]|uniref:uncharacterized protein LOC122663380 n=1 Tax=Telopea speciosissima TaxID=54955 RepID=UPI001CC47D85|nr:uncharacterized protein LOC122663380 [Telopea speciosissima]
MTDKAFTMLLELLQEALPEPNTLPKNMYETKKIIKDLGLNYNKIDACPNDCMLYWKGQEKATTCSKCGTSRYTSVDKKIPAKTLRHFPLIPRLQRLYMSSKTSFNMRWHYEGRTNDQRLRHPADGQAWKEFDKLHPTFSEEPRNIRLGLASDGFNPFKSMSVKYSIWPVVVMPYNLPPWMCMKPEYLMLTLLIPGPRQPGNDIDIYLQPLIEELKELWNTGVVTYDAYKKEKFKLNACLLWTINDFPAYAVLSGWSTKGVFACPCCNKNTTSHWLKYGRKHCYLGHHRFLPQGHRFRRDKKSFDGYEEHELQPKPLSGYDILEELEGVQFPLFGKDIIDKHGKKKKRRRKLKQPKLPFNWKKKSIFFEFPYWRSNLIRHNLDVMHIEKHVCDSIIGTLLDLKKKTKDNVKARLDLREIEIRSVLHPKFIEGKDKIFIPPACYTMSTADKDLFCSVLRGVKVPDGLCSNISRCVQERNILGMKSHDCHIMMQQLLPVALRGVLPKNVTIILIQLCAFFRDLCSKVGKEEDFKRLGESVGITLSNMEKLFPPSFFDIMVHLIIHLAHEAILAGPVQYRWMYPIERFLKQLKDYVRNLSRPEGSIAEGYIGDECLTFCSRYFEGVETRSNRAIKNAGSTELEHPISIFSRTGRPVGKCKILRLDIQERDQAHRYVLNNYDGLNEYRKLHKEKLQRLMGRKSRPHLISTRHAKEFPAWFNEHILHLRQNGEEVPHHIRWLARGPNLDVRSYNEYIYNGIKFRKDLKVILFHCDWADNRKGVEEDELGFVLVNFNHLLYSSRDQLAEPFVLPSQAKQVFYIVDSHRPEWQVTMRPKSRDIFDMGQQDPDRDDLDQTYTQSTLQYRQYVEHSEDDGDASLSWVRSDVEGIIIDTPIGLINSMESSDDDISN